MRWNIKYFASVLVLIVIGCGNFNSIHRDLKVDDGKGALVDIKQRAIIVSEKSDGSEASAERQTVVCAEPSPDALSAYAAEIAAEADLPQETTARLASAFQEGSSFTGLRTQSIQLLRDSLYRICEGYMNGALDELQYDILMRRYQKYMVALLAIEQLTGTIRAPAVTISTEGSAQTAKSIAQMRSEVEAIDAEIARLEEKKANAPSESQAEIEEKIKALETDKDAILKAIERGQELLAEGSATANVHAIVDPNNGNELDLLEISEAVKEIVMEIINTEDTGQLCFAYLRDDNNTSPDLANVCISHIENINNADILRIKAVERWLRETKMVTIDDVKKAKSSLPLGRQ